MPPNGIKKKVLGLVLISLGLITVLLSKGVGFALDGFYIAIMLFGVGLFIHGHRQHKASNLS